MRFSEAEQQYRALEGRLLGGELTENEFLAQVAILRVTSQDGRRWMISGQTGRWLVHDGQQWIFADPPKEEERAEAPTVMMAPPHPGETVAAPLSQEAAPPPKPAEAEATIVAPGREQAGAAATVIAPQAEPTPPAEGPARPMPTTSRWLLGGLVALAAFACLIGGGISAWVLFLRDWGEATPTPFAAAPVALVETYTPRPATPTYTPTWTPTPSRTPIPTATPPVTDTPPPTATLPPTITPAAPPAGSASATVVAVAASSTPGTLTYTVKPGETLSEIAARFGLTVEELAQANGITNVALVRAGQVLIIPASAAAPATLGPTPTWTPLVLTTPSPSETPEATATPSATSTPSPTPTKTGPSPTPKPTTPPKPTNTPTPKPVALTGKIAFTMWNPGTLKYDLYVSLIDGSGRNMIGAGFRQPQFRQDGAKLAVNGEANNLQHLVTLNANGGEVVEVSNYSEDSFPTWSPDGAIVAYSSSSWGDGRTLLGIVHDMNAKTQDWIKAGNTEVQGEFPFWMGDGRVVYHGCDFLGNTSECGLYWVGAGGGNYVRLTTERSDTAPAGFGSKVAFMSARDGNWEVYSVNMDGGGLKRLTDNNARDGLPTWSPDGKSIAFVSDRAGGWAVWVMNADGSNQRKLFDLEDGYGSGEYDWTVERISWAP